MPDFNDNISYIRSWKKKGDVVTILDDENCRVGRSDLFPVGFYNKEQINHSHIGQNHAKSLIIPAGFQATLFEGINFSGKSSTIKGPAKFCGNIPNFDKNTLSSLQVTRTEAPTSLGYWVEAYLKQAKAILALL